VSGLWTPSGEHVPDDQPQEGRADGEQEQPNAPDTRSRAGAASGRDPGIPGRSERDHEAERDHEQELARVRAELAATPVVDIVANHAVGLWQLALLHLDPEANDGPRLDEARLAIDALGALVEGLGDQLGQHAAPLRDALAQLRMVFVQVQGQSPS
jgi:hypothetical protein